MPKLPDLPVFATRAQPASLPFGLSPEHIVGACVLGAAGMLKLWHALGLVLSPTMLMLGADVVSGMVAAFVVAPLVAMVDSSVAKSSAGKSTPTAELWASIKALARAPHRSIGRLDFMAVNAVYVATYLTANMCGTLGASALTALVLVTGVNMWTGVKKDAFIAGSACGAAGGKLPRMPRRTLALFCARDSNAIGASFLLPAILAPQLAMLVPGMSPAATALTCQLLAPPLCETINTPIHLLALDVYNRPSSTPRARLQTVLRRYPRSLFVRLLRVIAAFSLGGITNRLLRDSLHGMIAVSGAVAV